jgi:uncharacterized membrane protein YbhN (UPF0104 family)
VDQTSATGSVPALRLTRRLPPVARRIAAAAGSVLAVAAAVVLLVHGGRLAGSIALIQHANLPYVWLAAVAFLGSLAASASAWRTTLAGCGGRGSRLDACARYGVGSLLNSFLPARLGDAVRISLFARTVPAGGSVLLVAAGALAAVEIAHVVVQTTLLAVASVFFALPLLPLAALAGGAAAVVGALAILRRHLKQRRIRHLLEGVDALVRDRRRGARVLGWTVAATICQIAAAAAIAASLGVHSPLTAAVLVTAALDLAGMVPLAPGNIGVTSAAVALALQRAGVNPTTAIASGLVFHGVQTLVGVTYGLISTALLTSESASAPRRRVRFVAAGAGVFATAASGAAVLPVLS